MAIVFCFFPSAVLGQTTAEGDKDFLTRLLQDSLGGEGRSVLVTGFRGALSSSASVEKITIADDSGIWLTLSDLNLKWNRAALLRGQIDITQLVAKTITLDRYPNAPNASMPSPEAREFKLPEFPVTINIADLRAERIILNPAILGEAVSFRLQTALRLANGEGYINALASRTDGARGEFKMIAEYVEKTNNLTLDIALTEAADGISARLLNLPGRPNVDLSIKGDGPLDEFEAGFQIGTNNKKRLSGEVVIGTRNVSQDAPITQDFSANIKGDVTALFATKYQSFFGEDASLRVVGTRTADGALTLSELALKTQELTLSGNLALDTDYWPTQINLAGEVEGEKPVLLPLAGVETRVDQADLVIQYNNQDSNQWTSNFVAQGLTREDVRIGSVVFSAAGAIDPDASAGQLRRVTARIEGRTSDVAFNNADIAQAFGEEIQAVFDLDYLEGQPLRLSNIEVTTATATMSGSAAINSLKTGFKTNLDARLKTSNLAKLSGLVGRNLDGKANLTLSGHVALGGAFDLGVLGEAVDLRIGQAEVDQLLRGTTHLSASVKRGTDGFELEKAEIINEHIALAANGRFASGNSNASFEARLADASQFERRLSGPASVSGSISEDAHGWSIDASGTGPLGSSASTVGLFTGPDAQLNFTADIPNIQPFSPSINGPLSLVGTVSQSPVGWIIRTDLDGPYGMTAGIAGRFTGGKAALQYTGRLPNLSVFVPQISGPLVLDGTARQAENDWVINTDVRGPAGTTADVAGRVRANGTLDLTAVGTAPLGLTEPFLQPRSLQGMARFDLAVNGPPQLTSVSGTVATADARFSIPSYQIALTGINAQAQLRNGRANVDVDGAISAGGRVSASGSIVLSGAYPADLVINLVGLTLADPSLYKTNIDGRITLDGGLLGGATIRGDLNIGQTDVIVPSSGITSFGEIPKINHVAASEAVKRTQEKANLLGVDTEGALSSGLAYPLDITVNAPSRFFIRGRGLDAEFGGRLRLTGTTNNIISSGRFNLVRGRLDILQKRFQLDEGSVQLQGRFNPFLRIVATTDTSIGSASVILEGPASELDVRFDSIPEAPQDEVLAQIFFRRDISQLSAFQALQLASAVARLAGRGGEGIISRIRRKFDLDDLDIINDEDGNTAVRVGKYITDNVYTDVTTTSKGDAEISINIDLTPNIIGRGSFSNTNESKLGIFLEKDY